MIKDFEIENYKCFQDFKVEGLSKINIITGKNNVGKTALLELIYLINSSDNLRMFISLLETLFRNRGLNRDEIDKYLQNININLKYNNINIKIKHKFIDELNDIEIQKIDRYREVEEFIILYKDSDKLEIFPFRPYTNRGISTGLFYRGEKKAIFIDSSKPNNSNLTKLYSNIQDLGIQHKFLEYLQILDKNIVGVEPQIRGERDAFLRINLENPKLSIISSELGEGTNRFIEILATILTKQNGTILIDEIENGIHHSKLKDIWKAIIEIAEKENIQLFVTTHDYETIEALNEASEELNYEKITLIELYKNEENKIIPIVMDYGNFSYGVEMGARIR